MKLRDLKISSLLYFSFAVRFLFVLVLAFIAWQQSTSLWEQTETMYEHPLPVSRAIREFQIDLVSIEAQMSRFLLAGDDRKTTELLGAIETHEADAARQLDVLEERYLGPAEDVSELRLHFSTWTAALEEPLRLLGEGREQEAAASLATVSTSTASAELALHLESVKAFAMQKADDLHAQAAATKSTLNLRLIAVVVVILVLSLLLSWALLVAIRRPLGRVALAADRFRGGDLSARSGYSSGNELGVLASSFDGMAESIEAEMQLREKSSHIALALAEGADAREFCRLLVRTLATQTGSQMAALYLLNEQRSAYEHYESVGLGERARAAFSAEHPEGEFGMALATGTMQHVTDVPAGTRFSFASVGGEMSPGEIITIPLFDGAKEPAVLSLATIGSYDPSTLQLLRETVPAISARLHGTLLFRQTRHLAERLDQQNVELTAQAKELAAQALEVTAQKDELASQTSELVEMNNELEEQKRQLEVADRLKSTFLSNMSHELRTPLNSVIALSGVLERRLAGVIPGEEHDYLEIIERNGKHLLALINDILDISRIEAGREEVELSEFNIRELVTELVASLAPLADEKGLALTNQVSEDLPLLCSDREKLRHILQNLVGNAIKFTDAGSVAISAWRTQETLRIVVRDTGVGIPASELPFIFDEFHRADVSSSRRHGGTGLGLSIARKYAEMLRGTITVRSSEDEGSAFTFELPYDAFGCTSANISQAASLNSPAAAGDDPAATAHGASILVVEDSEAIIVQMKEILTEQGYKVRLARNGIEALARIEEAVPDALILDLVMPEMDGFEVLEAIRAMEKTAKLPVLILTARQVTREEFGVLKQNHVQQLIRKGSVDRRELLAAIARLVRPTAAAPAGQKSDTRRPEAKVAGPRPVVLVVEDNPDNMRTMRALLADDYTMLEAVDGPEGVEKAGLHRPDVILMDLALPEFDGFTALDKIRENEALRAIPVVAVTASAMKGDREDILARGFNAYLSKPVDGTLLAKTLLELLGSEAQTR